MPPLLLKLIFDRIEQARMPLFARPIVRSITRRIKKQFVEPELTAHLNFLETALANRAGLDSSDVK
jgi:glutathione S-transferase